MHLVRNGLFSRPNCSKDRSSDSHLNHFASHLLYKLSAILVDKSHGYKTRVHYDFTTTCSQMIPMAASGGKVRTKRYRWRHAVENISFLHNVLSFPSPCRRARSTLIISLVRLTRQSRFFLKR